MENNYYYSKGYGYTTKILHVYELSKNCPISKIREGIIKRLLLVKRYYLMNGQDTVITMKCVRMILI